MKVRTSDPKSEEISSFLFSIVLDFLAVGFFFVFNFEVETLDFDLDLDLEFILAR